MEALEYSHVYGYYAGCVTAGYITLVMDLPLLSHWLCRERVRDVGGVAEELAAHVAQHHVSVL